MGKGEGSDSSESKDDYFAFQAMTVRFDCGIWIAKRVSRRSPPIARNLMNRYMMLPSTLLNHSSPVQGQMLWPKFSYDARCFSSSSRQSRKGLMMMVMVAPPAVCHNAFLVWKWWQVKFPHTWRLVQFVSPFWNSWRVRASTKQSGPSWLCIFYKVCYITMYYIHTHMHIPTWVWRPFQYTRKASYCLAKNSFEHWREVYS